MKKETIDQVMRLIDQTADEARRAALNEVLAKLYERSDTINRLLRNGFDVLAMSNGSRFEKLYNQRKKLFAQQNMLIRLTTEVYDMRFRQNNGAELSAPA